MVLKIDKWSWRALTIWWSALVVGLVVILVLLWAGRSTGPQTPELVPAVSGPVEAELPELVDPPPVVSPEPDPSGQQAPVPSASEAQDNQTEPVPDPVQPDDPDPAAALPDPAEDPIVPDLPKIWDQLSPVEKIALNPLNCDPAVEEISLVDGSCRRRSSLSSLPRPWNPVALNRVSTTELDQKPVSLACSTGDPVVSLPQTGSVSRAVLNQLGRQAESDPAADADLTCALRVTLEMTVDGFYFPDGCRILRPGFVQLRLSPSGSSARTYHSLISPVGARICTKAIIPVAKGRQIERIFKFKLKGADLDRQLELIKFVQLTPTVELEGKLNFVLGQVLVAPGIR